MVGRRRWRAVCRQLYSWRASSYFARITAGIRDIRFADVLLSWLVLVLRSHLVCSDALASLFFDYFVPLFVWERVMIPAPLTWCALLTLYEYWSVLLNRISRFLLPSMFAVYPLVASIIPDRIAPSCRIFLHHY